MNCSNCGMTNNVQATHCSRCNSAITQTNLKHVQIPGGRKTHIDPHHLAAPAQPMNQNVLESPSVNQVSTPPHIPPTHSEPVQSKSPIRKTRLEGMDSPYSPGNSGMPIASEQNMSPRGTDMGGRMKQGAHQPPGRGMTRLPVSENESRPQEAARLVGWLLTFDFNPSGQVYLIREGKTTIGRGRNNDHSLFFDETVSDRHATLIYRGGNLAIKDEGSTAGVFVNDKDIGIGDVQKLQNNDQVKIGKIRFMLFMVNQDSYNKIWGSK